MQTLRQKRLDDANTTLQRALAQRERTLATLVRAEARIKSLRLKVARLERAMAKPAKKQQPSWMQTVTVPMTNNPVPVPPPPMNPPGATPEPYPPYAEAAAERAMRLPDAPPEAKAMLDAAINDGLDIPPWLSRSPAEQAAALADAKRRDAEVAAQVEAETNERKQRKSRGRVGKMLAKKSGETKAMPLTGKAALRHINNE